MVSLQDRYFNDFKYFFTSFSRIFLFLKFLNENDLSLYLDIKEYFGTPKVISFSGWKWLNLNFFNVYPNEILLIINMPIIIINKVLK